MQNTSNVVSFGCPEHLAPFISGAVDALVSKYEIVSNATASVYKPSDFVNNRVASFKNTIDMYKRISYNDQYKCIWVDTTGKGRVGREFGKSYVAEVLREAERLYHEDKGEYETIVSIAVDARVDVKIWANKDMSDEDLKKQAQDEFAFMDLDNSNLEIVGSKPVNVYIEAQDYEHDFD